MFVTSLFKILSFHVYKTEQNGELSQVWPQVLEKINCKWKRKEENGYVSVALPLLIVHYLISIHLIFQKYIFAKLENLKPEMDQLVKELKGETAYAIKKFNWDEAYARRMFNLSVSSSLSVLRYFTYTALGLILSEYVAFVNIGSLCLHHYN